MANLLMTYQIRIQGQLSQEWAAWFGDVTITQEDGNTLLTCRVIDQAALFGLLRKVRDLDLPLLSVVRIDSESAQKENQGCR